MHLLRSTANLVLSTVLALGATSTPLALAVEGTAPNKGGPFGIVNRWNIGGEGGWGALALDSSAHRLYIPRTNRITVLNTQTGKISGEIEGLANVHEVALDASGTFGYATDPTDGSAGFVRVFDRSSLKLLSSIAVGLVPAAIVFEPSTKFVFAFNSHSHSATVIDTSTNQVNMTIALAGRPGAAVVDDQGTVFVTLPALGQIVSIPAATKQIRSVWQLAPCTGPTGLAIDVKSRQLLTTCEDKTIVAVNADTGAVSVIGDAQGDSGDIEFSAKDRMLFLADATGAVTVLHRDQTGKYHVLQRVKTEPGARTMKVNRDEGNVYLVTSKYGENTGAVSEELRYRPTPVPGTFSVIVVGPKTPILH